MQIFIDLATGKLLRNVQRGRSVFFFLNLFDTFALCLLMYSSFSLDTMHLRNSLWISRGVRL